MQKTLQKPFRGSLARNLRQSTFTQTIPKRYARLARFSRCPKIAPGLTDLRQTGSQKEQLGALKKALAAPFSSPALVPAGGRKPWRTFASSGTSSKRWRTASRHTKVALCANSPGRSYLWAQKSHTYPPIPATSLAWTSMAIKPFPGYSSATSKEPEVPGQVTCW